MKLKKKNYVTELKNEQLFFPKKGEFKNNNNKNIKYYNNFLLLSQKIIELFNDEFNFNFRRNLVECILGDNRVIIKYEENYPKILEIYKIKENTNYILIPELFLDYSTNKELNYNLRSIKENGYKSYINYNLMLSDDENDYASPIFNKNGNKIGYAFKLSLIL